MTLNAQKKPALDVYNKAGTSDKAIQSAKIAEAVKATQAKASPVVPPATPAPVRQAAKPAAPATGNPLSGAAAAAKPATPPAQPNIGKTSANQTNANAAKQAAEKAGQLAAAQEASKGLAVGSDGKVSISIQKSDSGYDNKIFFSTDNFKTRTYVGIDNKTGTYSFDVKPGSKLEFGIENGPKQFFRTGGAAANKDGFDHTKVSKTGNGFAIGFEDLHGGGDKDFNDAIISVQLGGAATAANTNRSGLGDGTNPGQGAGRSNSSNQGVNNPNNRIG